MTGLAAVLDRRTPPGVYRWHPAYDVAEVRDTVERAHWRFAHLGEWGSASKSAFLHDIATALDFPGYYGHNFDALAECLDVVAADTLLLWDGWGRFAGADPPAFAVAVSVLADRVADEHRGAFVVLLRGEGPEQALSGVDALG